MSHSKIGAYEGPRTPREDEWADVLEMSRSIFFPKIPTYREAALFWPMALQEDMRENFYAMFLDGRPVSGIGRVERDIVVRGHRLRMGFIGGVCTHPDHRGRGLAGTILAASMARFRENDVDFVYISGARSLYYGIGANHVGGMRQFAVRSDTPMKTRAPDVRLREAGIADVDLLASLSQSEGVRFVRPRSDYALSLTHGYCSGKACAFRVIEIGAMAAGYIIAAKPTQKEPNTVRVLEYAGDRLAILPAVAKMAQEANGVAVVSAPEGDPLGRLLEESGISGQGGRTSGTVKLLDFDRTMRKLRGYFAERMPADLAAGLQFSAGNGRYAAWNKKEILEVEGETSILRMLLGTPANEPPPVLRATEMMKALVEKALPLPLPSLHMNMI